LIGFEFRVLGLDFDGERLEPCVSLHKPDDRERGTSNKVALAENISSSEA
jgi:hypothetical protein